MNAQLMPLFSLEGRTALVTGGSRGIGMMIAAGFIGAGARVYISSRKAAACDAAAAELSASGGFCVSLPQDVSTVEGCRALAASYAEREAGLDILVNNAGAAWGASFDDFPEQGWDKVVDLNLKSPFFLTQAFAPALRAAASVERPAKVINVASIDGIRLGPAETYSYHASKAGLIYLTRRMAAQLIKQRICVTAIAPGAFASDMNRAAREQGVELAKLIPAGRIGTPEDMQGIAIYLASRAGDYAVGITVAVDGGAAFAQVARDFGE
jgi:2-deoxy-D-gluconate 3-dehydrogenase